MADDPYRKRRGLGAAFSLCALTTLTLLASHPGSGAHGLVAVINDEVAHRMVDAVVHSGFIVTLVALMSCFVLLSRTLGPTRARVVVGLTCFCTGCGALIASMVLDGLVTPAISLRLAGTDDLQMAKALFMLIGSLVGFLMPMGLLFQSAAILSWSTVIVEGHGARRAVGAFGLVVALSLIVAIFALPAATAAHVIIAGIFLESLWYLAIATLLFSRSSWPVVDGPEPT